MYEKSTEEGLGTRLHRGWDHVMHATAQTQFVIYSTDYYCETFCTLVLNPAVSQSSYQVGEADGFVQVCVDLNGGLPPSRIIDRTVTLTASTINGTAQGNYTSQQSS